MSFHFERCKLLLIKSIYQMCPTCWLFIHLIILIIFFHIIHHQKLFTPVFEIEKRYMHPLLHMPAGSFTQRIMVITNCNTYVHILRNFTKTRVSAGEGGATTEGDMAWLCDVEDVTMGVYPIQSATKFRQTKLANTKKKQQQRCNHCSFLPAHKS